MTILTLKKHIDIEKSIGNIKIDTIHMCDPAKMKHKKWTELHLWYDRNCENCPFGWEYVSYEGECGDCGCEMSKDGDFSAPICICSLPKFIKQIIIKRKGQKRQ